MDGPLPIEFVNNTHSLTISIFNQMVPIGPGA